MRTDHKTAIAFLAAFRRVCRREYHALQPISKNKANAARIETVPRTAGKGKHKNNLFSEKKYVHYTIYVV